MNKFFLIAAAASCSLLCGCSKPQLVSYSTAAVAKADISTSITATGTIEPVTEVEVGTQVSGIISKIYVDYNSEVKKGQVIAELDKTNLLSELTSARSNLANAQSQLDYQTSNYNRYKTLYDKGLVSADEFESARLSYEQAKQQIVVNQQSVQKAQTNLGYATITAPIDGIVLSKEVEEGQTVAASMTTPTLFIIAKDLTDMRVIANVDEADIGGVKDGQRVSFTVDAFPDDVFEGKVSQVRREATTTSNVVTYEVVVSAPNENLKLLPGLTANITIYTQERNGVLSVPAKALRFTPSEAILAPEESIADCDGKAKLWTKDEKVFRAYCVTTGLTNGTLTEVDGIPEGTVIITGYEVGGQMEEPAEQQQNSNPFMPGPPGSKKK